jgi:diguanylate cyclase (GGDEF)-like protein
VTTTTRAAWAWFAAVASGASVAYFAVTPAHPLAQTVIYLAVGSAAVAAMVAGVRRQRPEAAPAWYLLAAGVAAWVGGDLVWEVYRYALHVESPFPSWADAVYLGGYLLAGVGLVGVCRRRLPGRDAGILIDATIVAMAAAMASWVYLMAPYARDPGLSLLERGVSLAYPAADVVLLGIATRLLLTPGRRAPALQLLTVALVAQILADAAFGYLSLTGGYHDGHPVDAGWLAAYVLLGTLALHPSLKGAAASTPSRPAPLGRRRLAVLAAASLMAPAMMAVQASRGDAVDVPVFATGSALMFLLVVARLAGMAAALGETAWYDQLTRLPNRAQLLDRLEAALARAEADGGCAAVLFVDLDRFKLVNDTLGHSAGDRLLVAVAERLRRCVRTDDVVARLGGDEFVVLCPRVRGVADAVRLAERIEAVLAEPVVVNGALFFISASIGIALAQPPSEGPEALLRDADTAMYRAKQRGRSRYEVFDQAVRDATLARVSLERDLHRALTNGELEVHYQPVVCVATGRPVAVEALVRWAHPERGLLLPSEFLPVADECGLAVPLGEAVLATATRQAAAWQAALAPGTELSLSVNVSPRQLAHPEFPAHVAAAVASSGIAPGTLWLEVTEEALFDDVADAQARLRRLAAAGVRACLDDFGAGYSSLRYLRSLPVEAVKLDGSFAAGLGRDATDEAIVAAVLQMAAAVRLSVVVEGVETPAQLAVLRRLGAPMAQGRLFAHPMPAAAATDWLASHLPFARPARAVTARR